MTIVVERNGRKFMVQNFKINRNDIKKQITEIYGKVVYSHTTHLKSAYILEKENQILKWAIIILSAINAGGLITAICGVETKIFLIISACISTLLLALTAYQKAANLESQIILHSKTANELWKIREEYLSLLTDFSSLEDEKICERRDSLLEKLDLIYRHEPLTGSRAYKKAQKALKKDEEQFFSDDELNKMLPAYLRKDCNDKKHDQ